MDIPAHTLTPPMIDNHVLVQGGTNWDLSRSAVETPIAPRAEGPARAETPDVAPARLGQAQGLELLMRVHFSPGRAQPPAKLAGYLDQLPKGAVVVLRSELPARGCQGQALASRRLAALRQVLVSHHFVVLPSRAGLAFPPGQAHAANTIDVYLAR